MRLTRELIVHTRSRFQMREIGFLDVVLFVGIVARNFRSDEAMSVPNRNAEKNHEIFGRQTINLIFKLAQPSQKFVACSGRDSRALVREVRSAFTVRLRLLTR